MALCQRNDDLIEVSLSFQVDQGRKKCGEIISMMTPKKLFENLSSHVSFLLAFSVLRVCSSLESLSIRSQAYAEFPRDPGGRGLVRSHRKPVHTLGNTDSLRH
jgi:hypothetical protein